MSRCTSIIIINVVITNRNNQGLASTDLTNMPSIIIKMAIP